MGNLLASLLNSTGALQAYSRSLEVIQNNITNANTPGYVKQDQVLVSLPFDLSAGNTGGVLATTVQSARSSYLEQAVRSQQELLGDAKQRAADLSQVEPLFSLNAQSGIA